MAKMTRTTAASQQAAPQPTRATQAAQAHVRAAAPARAGIRPQPAATQAAAQATVPAQPRRAAPPPPPPPQSEPEPEENEGQEIATLDQGSGEVVPAWMRSDAGMGMENIGREDVDTPRMKLMQALSPELETYDDLRAGHFFHVMNEFSFEDQFIAVPVYMERG